MSSENDPGFITWLGKNIYDGAAYVVGALAMLLYKQGRDKARQDKKTLEANIASLVAAQDKMISKDDFEKHEEREEKDRGERRAAEASIRDQVEAASFERRQFEQSMHGRVDKIAETFGEKLNGLEDKVERKLDQIIEKIWK